jgi:hypothetical protein
MICLLVCENKSKSQQFEMERRMETKCAKKDSHFQFTHPVK